MWKGHEHLLPYIERELQKTLEAALATMHDALPASAKDLSPDVLGDLDLYLTVARTLLHPWETVASKLGNRELVKAILAAIEKGEGMSTVDLFGRARIIDFSQYTPRGHYVKEELQPYFQASMWLSRLEWNLVSRSGRSSAPIIDQSETPREATAVLALARLAAKTGALDALAPVEETWRLFAGKREDVSLRDLVRLADEAHIEDLRDPAIAAAKLRAAIGDGFRRTTNLHYAAGPMEKLPVIATVLGPRIVADATALGKIVNPEVEERYEVHAADVGYLLGQERARQYQREDRVNHPSLGAHLDAGRAALFSIAGTGDNLYSGWLAALTALSKEPGGAVPSFMSTPAFADLRLNTSIVGYGQLRHGNVLYAAEVYDLAGCEMPDAFVEPAPALYEALAAYAERGIAAAAHLPGDVRPYFENLALTMKVLRAISQAELVNAPLGREAHRFLSMVVEYAAGNPYGGESLAKYNGWYLHLFFDPHQHGLSRGEPFEGGSFIADYFTSSQKKEVAYVGALEPRLGIFVVDTGGPPRVVVGPVARGYEHQASAEHRLSDEEAMQISKTLGPWQTSYLVDGRGPPRVTWSVEADAVVAKATEPLGRVAFELMDTHGATCAVARMTPRETAVRGKLEDVPGRSRKDCHDVRVRLSDGTAWPTTENLSERGDWRSGMMLWIDPDEARAAVEEP